MAKEIEGALEELEKGLFGEESWKTESYKKLYEKEVDGIPVYDVKPWDVVVGDVLKLRSKEVLEQLEEKEEIPAHWFEELHTYIEEKVGTITVTEEIYKEIYRNERIIYSILFDEEEQLYWHISLPMLTYANEKVFNKEEKQKEELPPIYSIREKVKDPKIIAEMIKKVDKKRLKQLLNISASLGEEHRVIVDNKMVDKYLQIWANAKYEFYLLFGRQLELSQDIEFEITEDEIENLKKDVCKMFPKYAIYVSRMPSTYFVNNEITSNYIPSDFSEYAQPFFSGVGMKLSKFYSQFLQDPSFDIEISKIMQNKKVTGTVFLSIDPYDYLTSSINKHDWKSCHRITNGEWATGSLSYLLDDSTIVSYRAKRNLDYDYNYWGFKFKGNSKMHRQLVYFDKNSCNIIFGRQYPDVNKDVSTAIRYLLEDKVATFLGVENEWKVYNSKYDGEFTDICDMHYSDVHNEFSFKFARLKSSREGVADWKVGSNIPCLCGCGEYVDERGERAICSNCNEADEYDEDYE